MPACYNKIVANLVFPGIAGLYARNHINHKFGRWIHGALEKIHDNRVETFFESREASEGLL